MALKRFVTYLYEYEGGIKSKNMGFIRVDVRGVEVNMEVCVRNYMYAQDTAKIYALAKEADLLGIELGEVKMLNAQGDAVLCMSSSNIRESGFSLDDVEGIAICFENGVYLASCWKDEEAENIAQGRFHTYAQREKDVEMTDEIFDENQDVSEVAVSEVEVKPQLQASEEPQQTCDTTQLIYRKIELNQIREIPSPNWHLGNNSFLVHGFFNYGYLVLKKEMAEGKENLSLGVPGIFEKPEAVMAVLFGFSEFETIPQEMEEETMNVEREFSEIQKQDPKTGMFGCWFAKLQS